MLLRYFLVVVVELTVANFRQQPSQPNLPLRNNTPAPTPIIPPKNPMRIQHIISINNENPLQALTPFLSLLSIEPDKLAISQHLICNGFRNLSEKGGQFLLFF